MNWIDNLDEIFWGQETVKEAIYRNCIKLNEELDYWINFDLFTSPLFIEAFICTVCGYRQTAKQESFDGWDDDKGILIEVKYAQVMTVKNRGRRFVWTNLRGTSNKGKSAHVFVCVGYEPQKYDDPLIFFVIPRHKVGRKKVITYSFCKHKEHPKWSEYITDFSDLKTIIEQRYEEFTEWVSSQKTKHSHNTKK